MKVIVDYSSESKKVALNKGDIVTRSGEKFHYLIAGSWSGKVYFLCLETTLVSDIYDSIADLNHEFWNNSHFAKDTVTILKNDEWEMTLSRS
jgi:hypothetical protein